MEGCLNSYLTLHLDSTVGEGFGTACTAYNCCTSVTNANSPVHNKICQGCIFFKLIFLPPPTPFENHFSQKIYFEDIFTKLEKLNNYLRTNQWIFGLIKPSFFLRYSLNTLFNYFTWKELILLLLGIMNLRQYKFHTVVSEVSSLIVIGNSVH